MVYIDKERKKYSKYVWVRSGQIFNKCYKYGFCAILNFQIELLLVVFKDLINYKIENKTHMAQKCTKSNLFLKVMFTLVSVISSV